jgi:pre-rRNA-processing protein TSR1
VCLILCFRKSSKQARKEGTQTAHKKCNTAERSKVRVEDGPPKVVVLIPFHRDADVALAKRLLLSASGFSGECRDHHPQHVLLPDWAKNSKGRRQRLTFLDAPRSVVGVLDAIKCADMCIAVLPTSATFEDSAFDELGYSILSAVKNQGLPTCFGLSCGSSLASAGSKKASASRRYVERYFRSELGGDNSKFWAITNSADARPVIRCFANCTPNQISWRQDRGYLVADNVQHDASTGRLAVAGYVLGEGFSCNNLVHITGHGDYQLDSIVAMNDPCACTRNAQPSNIVLDQRSSHKNPDSLTPLRPYDPADNEQTWPSQEELDSAAKSASVRKIRIPKGAGTTDYEMAWCGEEVDDEEVACQSEMADEDESPPVLPEEEEDTNSEFGPLDELPEPEAQVCKERFTIEARAKEDLEFPDEVDTPMNVPARVRFQKYRGLRNFRKAIWDPYEELPQTYSRIFEFDRFPSTCKTLRKEFVKSVESKECRSGRYVCLYIDGVTNFEHPSDIPIIVSSLFEHERKVTVMHATATRGTAGGVLKSKDLMELHCGFRRFIAGPIYSEIPKKHVSDSKRKFERFFHENSTVGLSFFAPTMYPGAPLLAFKDNELVAWGSVGVADPLRCIIKRIVLTGYPFRVHKGKAVARHMFWNPTDIRYFKPLELVTKHGLRGHISEPLGTHGYMKCRFNGIVAHHDTFCLHLYKRVYPRWCPLAWGGAADSGPEDDWVPPTIP